MTGLVRLLELQAELYVQFLRLQISQQIVEGMEWQEEQQRLADEANEAYAREVAIFTMRRAARPKGEA